MELEFSDFIVAAIDEEILKDNNKLADAFKYFDKPGSNPDGTKNLEEEGYINHEKLLKAFNKCQCHPSSQKKLQWSLSSLSMSST